MGRRLGHAACTLKSDFKDCSPDKLAEGWTPWWLMTDYARWCSSLSFTWAASGVWTKDLPALLCTLTLGGSRGMRVVQAQSPNEQSIHLKAATLSASLSPFFVTPKSPVLILLQ
jgi:hypothetical protein